MQRSRYCWTVTMETVFCVWSVRRCYKQDSLKKRVGWWELSAVQLSEVTWSNWLVSERVQLWAASWKSACEEKTRRLVWNGRQSGTQLVQLSVDSWQDFSTGGCAKKTWTRQVEESRLCYISFQETANGNCNKTLVTSLCVSVIWLGI
jgi:hypothetical protein